MPEQSQATPQDRYAPPMAHVEDIENPSEGPLLAGRGRRFGAAMIDAGIGFTVLGLVAWLTPWNPWAVSERNLASEFAFNLAIGMATFLVIHGWLLLNRGQTVGKAALGLRIVRPDGSRANAWQLLGMRYGLNTLITVVPFAGGVYALVDALFIFRASRRCLHDSIAGTIVVTA